MKRNIQNIGMTIFMLLTFLQISAQDCFTYNGIKYRISNYSGYVGVSGLDDKCITDLVIPSKVYFNSCNYTVYYIDPYAFHECSGLKSVTIPDSVTSIGEGAFEQCSGLTSVTIPDSVTSIGDYAFGGCSSLVSVIIPESVNYIGSGAFYFCSNLTSVTIPDSVTSIRNGTFYYCYNLKEVIIPESVNYIEGNAFEDCFNLIKAAYPSSIRNPFLYAIAIRYPVNSVIDEYGVIYDESMQYIYYVPLKLEGTFQIPDSVTYIGGSAFYDCSGLTSVNIPDSVTSIGDYAFGGCSGLTSVICKKENPSEISLGNYIFSGVDKSNCTLYVPRGCKELYASAEQWKCFQNIVEIEPEPEPSTQINADVNGDGVINIVDVTAVIEALLAK